MPKTTPKKREPLDEMMSIPVTREMKQEIVELAEAEERKPADMGRVLWREALEARKVAAAAAHD